MAPRGEIVHKTFVSLLGLATAGAGVWLGLTMFNGFRYHSQVRTAARLRYRAPHLFFQAWV